MIAAGPPAKRPPHNWFRSGGPGWPSGWSRWLATLGLALVVVLSAALAAEEGKIRLGEFIPVTPPQPVPAVTITDLDGKPVSLADFKGHPAVVNLWATWCQPCLKEMPSLEYLRARFDGKLVVAAVSQDHAGARVVAPFVEDKGLQTLAIYLDPKGELGHALKARGLPTSIVVDADGNIVGRVEGAAEWDSDKMLAVLQPLFEGTENVKKPGG